MAKTPRSNDLPYRAPKAWKDAVASYATDTLTRKGGPLHGSDKKERDLSLKIMRGRVEKLANVISFYRKNGDFRPQAQQTGPFEAQDGAALVLWSSRKAHKLARLLLGHIAADNFFHPESSGGVNMNWFDFEIEQ